MYIIYLLQFQYHKNEKVTQHADHLVTTLDTGYN